MKCWLSRSLFLCSLSYSVLSAQEALTNETIVKLAKASIGEETIAAMVNQQPGKYSLSADDIASLKTDGVSDRVIALMILRNGNAARLTPADTNPASAPGQPRLVLHDATPIRLRLSRNLSSSDSKVGDTVDFEVLDDLKVDDLLLIARGGTAIATITEAQAKRRMARGGKLDVTIDYVRLANGDKVALRAVKEGTGGGHAGAMTGGMIATAVVFFPAAPLFLFMHGKDVTIPKGTEIRAYVNGEIKLDRDKLKPAP